MSTALYAKVSMFPVLCSSKQVSQNLLVTCAVGFRVLLKKTELPFVVNSQNLSPRLVFMYYLVHSQTCVLLIMW